MAFFSLTGARWIAAQETAPQPIGGVTQSAAQTTALADAPEPQIEVAGVQAGQSSAGQQPSGAQTGQTQPAAPAASSPSAASGQSQNCAQPAAGQSGCKDKADSQTSGQGKVAGTSNDRLFYTLPNFLTLQSKKQLPPMSAGDKFKAVALGTFDYVEYPWWGVLAAISQADDGDPAYGQGWTAYAKRYGTTAGDSMIENFMVGAVFPSILRQDPRYYQSGRGSFFRRTGYSVSRIFVTLSDSGRTQFNYSEIFGAATAAAISTYSYHPRSAYISTPSNPHQFIASERSFSNVASTWGTQVGLDTFTLVVKEFWPDIHRKISKKQKANIGSQPGKE